MPTLTLIEAETPGEKGAWRLDFAETNASSIGTGARHWPQALLSGAQDLLLIRDLLCREA
jgi:hypothetical protein